MQPANRLFNYIPYEGSYVPLDIDNIFKLTGMAHEKVQQQLSLLDKISEQTRNIPTYIDQDRQYVKDKLRSLDDEITKIVDTNVNLLDSKNTGKVMQLAKSYAFDPEFVSITNRTNRIKDNEKVIEDGMKKGNIAPENFWDYRQSILKENERFKLEGKYLDNPLLDYNLLPYANIREELNTASKDINDSMTEISIPVITPQYQYIEKIKMANSGLANEYHNAKTDEERKAVLDKNRLFLSNIYTKGLSNAAIRQMEVAARMQGKDLAEYVEEVTGSYADANNNIIVNINDFGINEWTKFSEELEMKRAEMQQRLKIAQAEEAGRNARARAAEAGRDRRHRDKLENDKNNTVDQAFEPQQTNYISGTQAELLGIGDNVYTDIDNNKKALEGLHKSIFVQSGSNKGKISQTFNDAVLAQTLDTFAGPDKELLKKYVEYEKSQNGAVLVFNQGSAVKDKKIIASSGTTNYYETAARLSEQEKQIIIKFKKAAVARANEYNHRLASTSYALESSKSRIKEVLGDDIDDRTIAALQKAEKARIEQEKITENMLNSDAATEGMLVLDVKADGQRAFERVLKEEEKTNPNLRAAVKKLEELKKTKNVVTADAYYPTSPTLTATERNQINGGIRQTLVTALDPAVTQPIYDTTGKIITDSNEIDRVRSIITQSVNDVKGDDVGGNGLGYIYDKNTGTWRIIVRTGNKTGTSSGATYQIKINEGQVPPIIRNTENYRYKQANDAVLKKYGSVNILGGIKVNRNVNQVTQENEVVYTIGNRKYHGSEDLYDDLKSLESQQALAIALSNGGDTAALRVLELTLKESLEGVSDVEINEAAKIILENFKK